MQLVDVIAFRVWTKMYSKVGLGELEIRSPRPRVSILSVKAISAGFHGPLRCYIRCRATESHDWRFSMDLYQWLQNQQPLEDGQNAWGVSGFFRVYMQSTRAVAQEQMATARWRMRGMFRYFLGMVPPGRAGRQKYLYYWLDPPFWWILPKYYFTSELGTSPKNTLLLIIISTSCKNILNRVWSRRITMHRFLSDKSIQQTPVLSRQVKHWVHISSSGFRVSSNSIEEESWFDKSRGNVSYWGEVTSDSRQYTTLAERAYDTRTYHRW